MEKGTSKVWCLHYNHDLNFAMCRKYRHTAGVRIWEAIDFGTMRNWIWSMYILKQWQRVFMCIVYIYAVHTNKYEAKIWWNHLFKWYASFCRLSSALLVYLLAIFSQLDHRYVYFRCQKRNSLISVAFVEFFSFQLSQRRHNVFSPLNAI